MMVAQIKYPIQIIKNEATVECSPNAFFIVLSKKTAESCPWARERAQRRKYEAVFETVPRANSIVSIN